MHSCRTFDTKRSTSESLCALNPSTTCAESGEAEDNKAQGSADGSALAEASEGARMPEPIALRLAGRPKRSVALRRLLDAAPDSTAGVQALQGVQA